MILIWQQISHLWQSRAGRKQLNVHCLAESMHCLASSGQTVFLFDVKYYFKLDNVMDKRQESSQTDKSLFSVRIKKLEGIAERYFGH